MIVRETLPLSRLLHFVARRIVIFFLVDSGIAIAYTFYNWRWLALPELPLGMIGAALTVFLGFRIKAAYDRWWEARVLWGALVNWSRTLARRSQIFATPNVSEKEITAEGRQEVNYYSNRVTYLQIAYVHALRSHLRGHDPLPELPKWLEPAEIRKLEEHANVPAAILMQIGQLSRHALERGWISDFRMVAIEEALAEITNVQGGCERIKNTPIPRQFAYFPRLFTNAYCLMMPIGLVASLGLLTPVASTLTAFMMLSLESFGSHIESPFENTINDVPMTALARTIEINLKQGLGEQNHNVPAPLTPVEGFLF